MGFANLFYRSSHTMAWFSSRSFGEITRALSLSLSLSFSWALTLSWALFYSAPLNCNTLAEWVSGAIDHWEESRVPGTQTLNQRGKPHRVGL